MDFWNNARKILQNWVNKKRRRRYWKLNKQLRWNEIKKGRIERSIKS